MSSVVTSDMGKQLADIVINDMQASSKIATSQQAKKESKDKEIATTQRKETFEERYKSYELKVKNLTKDFDTDFISLAHNLSRLEDLGYYRRDYDNFFIYCDEQFKLEKTQVSRLNSIYVWFCFVDSKSDSSSLHDRYKDFSYSQLVEILPLVKKGLFQTSGIEPNWTIARIRDYKASLKPRTVADSDEQEEETQEDNYAEMAMSIKEELYELINNIEIPYKEKTPLYNIYKSALANVLREIEQYFN